MSSWFWVEFLELSQVAALHLDNPRQFIAGMLCVKMGKCSNFRGYNGCGGWTVIDPARKIPGACDIIKVRPVV